MQRIVALDLAGGPAFLDALRRTWDAGDVAFPVDQRLPAPARRALLGLVRPHVVVAADSIEGTPLHPDAPLLDTGDALLVATSGSTGEPKLVVHVHAGLAAHAAAVHARLAVHPSSDRWLACLPLHHLGGFGVVARSLLTDTPVDLLPGFDAEAVAAAPAALGTTLVSLVPTALDRVGAAAFRWVVLGGAADPVERPANVVRTYGMTETGGGVVYDGVPLDGVDVRLDADGAIAVRTATIARGRRLADGSVVPLTDTEGWLPSGDIGRWEGERLVVEGRADALIITGGENVWPEVVERRLRAHPSVADAAVVGEPDPTWGQRVAAHVVPADPARPPTLDELRAHVRAELPAAAAPRVLHLAAAIPRTALGKVDRSRLS